MSWSRLTIEDAFGFAWPYVDTVVSPLKAITKAVYESQMIAHLRQGFRQIFRVPDFLHTATQTRDLINASINLNVWQYGLPVVVYYRLYDACLWMTPDSLDPVIHVIHYFFLLNLSRLFLFRTLDNTFLLLSLPRTVANDLAERLPHELSQRLANDFIQSFVSINLDQIDKELLIIKLKRSIKIFMKKNDFSESAFAQFQTELNGFFVEFMQQQEALGLEPDFTDTMCFIIAKIMTDQLVSVFHPAKVSTFLQDKAELNKILLQTYSKTRASEITEDICKRINQSISAVTSMLPITYPPCGCGPIRLMRGMLSTPLCHTGNIILSSLPALLNNRGWFLPDSYRILIATAYIMKLLAYGQALDAEYKTPGHCTRHRYRVFSRNKAYSLAIGMTYLFSVEALSLALSTIMNVDNFFTRDAIANMVMMLVITPTRAFREPLPGKKENTWDLFTIPRKITMFTVRQIHYLFLPDLNRPDSREKCYHYLKENVTSPVVVKTAKWFFGSHDYFPSRTLNVDHVDIVASLLSRPSIARFLQLYRHDIQETLSAIGKVHQMALWINTRAIPPSWVSSFVVFPLLLLKEEALKSFVEEFRLRLYGLLLPLPEIVAVTVAESIPDAKVVLEEKPLSSAQQSLEDSLALAMDTPLVTTLNTLPIVVNETEAEEEPVNIFVENPPIVSLNDNDLDDDDEEHYRLARSNDRVICDKNQRVYGQSQFTLWKNIKKISNTTIGFPVRRSVDIHKNEYELKTF